MLDRSRLGRSLETVAYLSRNWKFESISLHRRVHGRSVAAYGETPFDAEDALRWPGPEMKAKIECLRRQKERAPASVTVGEFVAFKFSFGMAHRDPKRS